MTDLPPDMQPDELRALREQLANNLRKLEQLSFAKSLDGNKEAQVVVDLRSQLDATVNLLNDLGKPTA